MRGLSRFIFFRKSSSEPNSGPSSPKQFGAFSGVFVPTFLSIIGVIMYLRLGYVVGQAGVLWSILIILLAVSVTFSTGLALSSITSNIRIGSGAVYSIISKTLGIEVGGSVGIPLYLAQVFSVALYVLGFAEGWQFLFPSHSLLMVSVVTFCVLLGILSISTEFAIKAQFIVFLVTLVSLFSIFSGGEGWFLQYAELPYFGSFSQDGFWDLFALFFPAVTGLMAGIGLSGELSDPKRQIPRGVLSALVVTTIIYIAMVLWFGSVASLDELSMNSLLIVEVAAYGPIVLAGILAATFSSALTTFVAAPRLLAALSESSIVPFSGFFQVKHQGEPRRALIFTSLVILSALLLGSLDAIAPILTMFFLITYAMINLVVFLEQSLGLPSFRPTFRVPRFVSLYGALGSIVFMFLISPTAGILSLVFLGGLYISLVRRHLVAQDGDVRSGLFRSLAEWAAKKVQTLPESRRHTWKPNILLPALTTTTVFGNFPLIKAIAYPNGTMTVLGMKVKHKESKPHGEEATFEATTEEAIELDEIVKKFAQEGIFTSSSLLRTDDYSKGIALALEAIESQIFHPNILFLPFKPQQLNSYAMERIYAAAHENMVSVVLFDRDEELSLGSQEDIHVWIHPRVLDQEFYADRDFDLSLLLAYKLQRNCGRVASPCGWWSRRLKKLQRKHI